MAPQRYIQKASRKEPNLSLSLSVSAAGAACFPSAAIGAQPSRSPEHSQFIDKSLLLISCFPHTTYSSINLRCCQPICCTSVIANRRLPPIHRLFSSSTRKFQLLAEITDAAWSRRQLYLQICNITLVGLS